MLCSTCQGLDFDQDDQGLYVCRICGTASQDYIFESHDDDFDTPGLANSAQDRGKYRLTSLLQVKNKKIEDKVIKKKVKDADISDVLSGFQCGLLLCAKSVIKEGNIDIRCDKTSFISENKDNNVFMSCLKKIWFQYIDKLRLAGVKLMKFYEYEVSAYLHCTYYKQMLIRYEHV
jgi:hypothetical protein